MFSLDSTDRLVAAWRMPTVRRVEKLGRESVKMTSHKQDVAVSVTNNCGYCVASYTAAARRAGMTDEMFGELQAIIGMANETNRLAVGYRVPIDPAFE